MFLLLDANNSSLVFSRVNVSFVVLQTKFQKKKSAGDVVTIALVGLLVKRTTLNEIVCTRKKHERTEKLNTFEFYCLQ